MKALALFARHNGDAVGPVRFGADSGDVCRAADGCQTLRDNDARDKETCEEGSEESVADCWQARVV